MEAHIFDASVPSPKQEERLLLKNTHRKEIRARIARAMEVRD
jgi:hypothetical protein